MATRTMAGVTSCGVCLNASSGAAGQLGLVRRVKSELYRLLDAGGGGEGEGRAVMTVRGMNGMYVCNCTDLW